jgi:threonine synthase
MVACQSEAAQSVAMAWKRGLSRVAEPHLTGSIAISLLDPLGGDHALSALYESDGCPVLLTDAELVQAVRDLGTMGVLAEPSGAAGLAGARKMAASTGRWTEGGRARTTVVIVTGGGARWLGTDGWPNTREGDYVADDARGDIACS